MGKLFLLKVTDYWKSADQPFWGEDRPYEK